MGLNGSGISEQRYQGIVVTYGLFTCAAMSLNGFCLMIGTGFESSQQSSRQQWASSLGGGGLRPCLDISRTKVLRYRDEMANNPRLLPASQVMMLRKSVTDGQSV